MKLYHCAGSRGLRALWTIEEMGLPCELVLLPFPPRAFAKHYFAVNPLGTVPSLIDGDTTLTESTAIAQYLATKYGPTHLAVTPYEADYGRFLDFLHHSDATLTFPQTVFLRFTRMAPDATLEPAGEAYAEWFGKRLVKAAQRLDGREYLAADRFTIADIAVGYALYLATRIGLADRVPAILLDYLERLMMRGGFVRAIARETEAGAALGIIAAL